MKSLFLTLFLIISAQAHFLTLTSNTDNVNNQAKPQLHYNLAFIHPFEQSGMELEKPEAFLNKKPLTLQKTQQFGHTAWKGFTNMKTPGVYMIHAQPKPYFEPAEGKYIVHVPKLIVSAYGVEQGWDEPLGLKYEIIPMVKPFGLYAGNLFQGKVLHNGKPASNVEVEVELYNEFGLKAASDAHITQVVKTDSNGVFSFVMNHKGWWGFAALIEEGSIKHQNGQEYPVENGALLWVKAY